MEFDFASQPQSPASDKESVGLAGKSQQAERGEPTVSDLEGRSRLLRRVARRLVNALDTRPEQLKGLTSRQREVLQLLAEGYTMKQAAGVLKLTQRTIAFHKYRIKAEFGLKTNSDFIRLAIREKCFNLGLSA